MSQKRKRRFSTKLEDRFKAFLDTREHTINLDSEEASRCFSNSGKADYIIDNNIIVEIKTLTSDPAPKIEALLKPHRDRDDFPLFYDEWALNDVLKHLPDGKEINKKIFFSITKSVQSALEKADDQIAATKEIIGNPNATGVVALLNEEIVVFEPKVIGYIARYMMGKIKDGDIRYKNIHFVYFISEAHFYKYGEKVSNPLMIIDGPNAKHSESAIKRFEKLNKEWAIFNDGDLINNTDDSERFLHKAFFKYEDLFEPDSPEKLKRYELWRSEYRQDPYLRKLSHEEMIQYGLRIMKDMEPHFLKGRPKKSFEETQRLMIMWTHFLDECSVRKLDLKEVIRASHGVQAGE